MRNLDKRIDKLSANLSAKERSLAIVDAISREDMNTAQSLVSSAPMKSYSQRDAAVIDFVDTIEIISLVFDRGFYAMKMALLEIDLSDSSDKLTQRHLMEHEIRGFIAGLQLFAHRIDVSLDRLLAFSIAHEQKLTDKHLQELESLSDEDKDLAEQICSIIEELWKNRAKLTVFSVAPAS